MLPWKTYTLNIPNSFMTQLELDHLPKLYVIDYTFPF